MNEKFYSLPEEKQQKIIHAGFRVFSQNSYKKSPMNEIADCAGISKSLLFHYFHNKKELYLFLWDKACEVTMKYLNEYGCYEPDDLFEMMERGMRAKIYMMKKYPSMTAFVVKAFYEKDPEINSEIRDSYRKYFDIKANNALARVDTADFVEGLDLSIMYREMYLASEGYLWEIFQSGDELDVPKLEKDFEEMLKFWKKIYLKKGVQFEK
ncbi:MAG: TetR/AcrR family transcriptional regulator [Lachnospiraceae bacterium]|nr:TetR/AcrR family transcriptional regulator [Lachnospiraceae bacterium]